MRGTVAILVSLAACGGSTQPSGGTDASTTDAVTDAPGTSDVLDAATGDAPLDAGYLACFSDTGQLSPSLKTCQSDSDCVIEQEQTDCCGTILYVGVSASQVGSFTACETAWVAHFPGCGCASNAKKTEDGMVLGMDGSAALVHCTDFTSTGGVCMTYAP